MLPYPTPKSRKMNNSAFTPERTTTSTAAPEEDATALNAPNTSKTISPNSKFSRPKRCQISNAKNGLKIDSIGARQEVMMYRAKAKLLIEDWDRIES